jgi:CRP-like cAMP-binding protein
MLHGSYARRACIKIKKMTILNEILGHDYQVKITRLKKGDILQRTGELSSKAFFVKNGLLRSYTIDDKGKVHIFMFAPEGWIVADFESQEFEQPAELFIDAIEDSEVVILDRKLLTESDLNTIQVKRNVKLLSRRIGILQRRIIMLMSASAKQRYDFFLDAYPELPNRIPQKMIASYLGITPQALSTIRGKMARKK